MILASGGLLLKDSAVLVSDKYFYTCHYWLPFTLSLDISSWVEENLKKNCDKQWLHWEIPALTSSPLHPRLLNLDYKIDHVDKTKE